MEVLGLVLPDGRTVISLLEDVDEVDPTDPVWVALVEGDGEDLGEDEDDDYESWDDDDEKLS
jgi:hypothetical protein